MIQPNPNFKAIYNPYLRKLLVRYGNALTENFFQETEEWTKVSFNGDDEHPNYLHIQIDYDECFQLLFYPRVDGSDSLNENIGSYYFTCDDVPNCTKNSKNIRIVHNNIQWEKELKSFLKP